MVSEVGREEGKKEGRVMIKYMVNERCMYVFAKGRRRKMEKRELGVTKECRKTWLNIGWC